MLKTKEVKFAHVSCKEVFESSDWPGHFFVPFHNHGAEAGAALRVKKVGREWRPFDESLHAELSFFTPDEPGCIVGHFKRSRA
jgi:hypothetical protein